ncbi:hypothetical protein GCM10022228_07610 [Halomonas cibimaris]|uniref:Capsule biosynthesis GfcC-like C-terminal domain-containing protein n=1 Tax=Halomonas cibimaris TaxID=657012 RepID=A0ABP7LEP8_9GAMM
MVVAAKKMHTASAIHLKRRLGAFTTAMCLALAPLPALGQTSSTKLSEGWLNSLSSAPAIVWSHAFALRDNTAATVDSKRRRLIAELETLITSARLNNGGASADGLTVWRQRLAEDKSLPARTPGRFDLPWLGAHPRQDPPLAKVALWGSCKPPAWVEIWHLKGVTRLPWQAGMTLDEALKQLPPDAYASADNAWLITPTGKQHRRGIAAWNAEPTPLTPGSRVTLALPDTKRSLSGLLSSRSSTASRLINQRLPTYLATRLPSDDCTIWRKDT